ncbi:MAG: T9SS type A sorting domain-containing protein [Candidatus Aegiribacteria sp.]|nr:T9SS type A sorting domain-containing protein [Candidatus Aegiribacteria sp.]
MRMTEVLMAVLVIIPFSLSIADSATQTDWSGGSGVPGPNLVWSDQFCSSSGICPTNPGSLMLGTSPKDEESHFLVLGKMLIRYAVACDVNGDGHIDVAFSDTPVDSVFWMENVDGSGEQWITHSFPVTYYETYCLDPVDLDADGDIDFLISSGDDFYYYENLDGVGDSWQGYPIALGYDWAWRIIHADIDGDDDLDAIGCAKGQGTVIIFENVDGFGHDWSTVYQTGYFGYPSWLRAADADGDGDTDIFCGDGLLPSRLGWIEQVNQGTWTTHSIIAGYHNTRSGLPYDWDLDGDIDLLTGYSHTHFNLELFLNTDGSANNWEQMEIFELSGTSKPAVSMDIDCDGDMDVLGCERYPDILVWYENISGNAMTWERHTFWSASSGIGCWSAGDIDENGYTDAISRWASMSGDTELYWIDFVGPSFEGWLESSILDIDENPYWEYIDWTADVPAGCALAFLVRSSDDPEDMGNWSDTLTAPCSLEGILNDNDSYFQYRVLIERSDPSVSPALEDITITWSPTGIAIDPTVDDYILYGAIPNPSAGLMKLEFSIPETCMVQLRIFDITGRLISNPVNSEFSAGQQEVQLSDLRPGIYFVRMEAGTFRATQRFVVIE